MEEYSEYEIATNEAWNSISEEVNNEYKVVLSKEFYWPKIYEYFSSQNLDKCTREEIDHIKTWAIDTYFAWEKKKEDDEAEMYFHMVHSPQVGCIIC